MEKERERETNYRSVGYTNGQWSQTFYSSKALNMLNRKKILYVDRWKNEEGKHNIECSLNKYPLNLMNQQILEYKRCLMGKIQQILCCLGIHKSLVAFDPKK
jgi:hypothetical protein